MPMINKNVASLKVQFHCMNLIKKTISFINQDQIPVDVSGQPVFALSKEVQLRHPSVFDSGKYVCLLVICVNDISKCHTSIKFLQCNPTAKCTQFLSMFDNGMTPCHFS